MDIRVEIVLALPGRQYIQCLDVPANTRVSELVSESRILEHAPGMGMEVFTLAIHGRAVEPWTTLRDGDRVEILRPLTVDPKQARRRRAQLKSDA